MSKKKIDLGFTPSPYQEKIFDFIQHGVGNAVISAFAGTGKTKTITTAMKFIPENKKCLFLAFNKSIADELTEKLKDLKNVSVRTSHSLGLLMLRRNLGNDIEIDEYKYTTYVKKHISGLTSLEETPLTRKQIQEYIESIISLINFSRLNLAQSVKEINNVANKYDIPISFDECDVVLKCLEWGKSNTNSVDYTDMLWLPVELNLKPSGLQYDWVFGDEMQDFSILMYELVKKTFKRGTRSVFVGDFFQMIYAFAGSNEESFNNICEQPNTTVFELPITYRCGKKITEFANNLVPDIKPREDAPDGRIVQNCSYKELKDGDMVLARSKAPLLNLYVKLLRRGVNCYIKGQDIGSNLIKLLDGIDEDKLNTDLNNDGVFVRLYDRLFNERNRLMIKRGLDMNDATLSSNIMNMYDSINALIILAEKCTTKKELMVKINNIFQEKEKGVCLSTIHKAKGLEADNIYILCHSAMLSKLAKHDWEKIQEKNLQYVAYTRAKLKLGFISEKEIPPSGSMMEPTAILDELRYIENKVCSILGKEPMQPMNNVEIAQFNLRNATKISDLHENDNSASIEPTVTETNNSSMTDDELLTNLLNFIQRGDKDVINTVKQAIDNVQKNQD